MRTTRRQPSVRICAYSLVILCAANAAVLAEPKVEEEVLGPAGKTLGVTISSRGLHVATLLEKGSRQVMSVDGVQGPPFTMVHYQAPVGNSGVIFSEDGKRHAYVVKMGDDWVMILDGKEVARGKIPQPGQPGGLGGTGPGFSPDGTRFFHSTYEMVGNTAQYKMFMDGAPAGAFYGIEPPVFSADGSHYAFFGTQADGRTKVLVVDGKPTQIPGQEPQFTPDGKNLLTIERRGTEAQVFINGKPGSRAKNIVSIHMSPAGLNLMVIGTVSAGQGFGTYLGFAGKKLEGSDCQNITSFTFSPDGKRYAALCDNGSTKFIFLDGKRGLDYALIRDFKFSEDSSKFVYLANAGSKTFVVVNDEESDGYPIIQDYVIGGGGKSVGFIGYDPSTVKSHVIINGKATAYDNPGYLAFSPDGSRHGFAVGRGLAGTLYLDGVEQKGVGIFQAGGMLSHQSFSPDNKHSVHHGFVDSKISDQGLVVNGKLVLKELAGLDGPFLYTPDGRHVLFFGPKRSGGRFLWLDGQPVAQYSTTHVNQGISHRVEMSPEGVLTFIAKHDESIKRYRVTPSADTSIATLLASTAK